MDVRFGFLVLVGLVGCSKDRAVREWRPSDHQPPPAASAQLGPGAAPEEAPAAANDAAQPSAGEALWRVQCASCHGLAGRGDGPVKLARPAQNFTDQAWQKARSDEAIALAIAQGRGSGLMPAYRKVLSEEAIGLLVQVVRGFGEAGR